MADWYDFNPVAIDKVDDILKEKEKEGAKLETPEIIKLKRRLDGLQERLLDMMDDVHELQQDIQFLYRNVEKIYEIIEEGD